MIAEYYSYSTLLYKEKEWRNICIPVGDFVAVSYLDMIYRYDFDSEDFSRTRK